MKSRLVLIGNGMAGAKLLDELLAAAPELYDITVFGNEPYGNYNRIMLSPLLAGEKTLDEIMIYGQDWYDENGITLNTGPEKAISKIDRIAQEVVAADGEVTAYDRLVIATGSSPFILPISGNQLDGVMSFRDIADVENIIAASAKYKHAAVIGAGLLGLEAAMGLVSRGMQVTVIHSNSLPLNRQLDQTAGEMLQQALSEKGLNFKMNARTSAIVAGERNGPDHISTVHFQDGSELDADLLIMATGIRPNKQLAEESGLYCEHGIVVNDTLQTYDPRIYALGECIQHRGETFGLVAPLYDQAKVLANHLSEHGVASYQTLPTATKLKVTGINLFSVGNYLGGDDTETIAFYDKSAGTYKKLVLKDDRVEGALLYGDIQEGAFFHELLDSKESITSIRPYLLFGRALCDEIKAEREKDVCLQAEI